MSDVYGSSAKPVSLDPFATIVEINFPPRLIAFEIKIERSPTIAFQRTLFETHGTDRAREPADNDLPVSEFAIDYHTTQFRWVWATQIIQKSNWNGSIWTSIKDGEGDIVSGFFVLDGGTFEQVRDGPKPVFAGLPKLPTTQSLLDAAASTGNSPSKFAPQARWVPIEGPEMEWRPPVSATRAFRRFTGAATIQLVGIRVTGNAAKKTSLGDFKAYEPEVHPLLFDLEGGWLPPGTSNVYPSTFSPLTIPLATVGVTIRNRKYKVVGAVDVPVRQTAGSPARPDFPGSLWVLCAHEKDKRFF